MMQVSVAGSSHAFCAAIEHKNVGTRAGLCWRNEVAAQVMAWLDW